MYHLHTWNQQALHSAISAVYAETPHGHVFGVCPAPKRPGPCIKDSRG